MTEARLKIVHDPRDRQPYVVWENLVDEGGEALGWSAIDRFEIEEDAMYLIDKIVGWRPDRFFDEHGTEIKSDDDHANKSIYVRIAAACRDHLADNYQILAAPVLVKQEDGAMIDVTSDHCHSINNALLQILSGLPDKGE